jgi:hypothetical protein
LEDFVKFSLRLLFLFAILTLTASFAAAQVDSIVGQFTSVSGGANVFVRSISGDGRFVVVESNGDIATERNANRNNADGNNEIFLFDYAQRRIFQITNTRHLLVNAGGSTTANENIRVAIVNTLPVISNVPDASGSYWISFVSNATTSAPPRNGLPGLINGTNPGNFNGNDFNPVTPSTTPNPLLDDANTEIWLYQIPAVPAIDLSLGADLPITNLTGGTFIQVTNSLRQFTPEGGTTSVPPRISFDNDTPSINDNGTVVAFVSDREYIGNTNGGGTTPNPSDVNREIFVYVRTLASGNIKQITQTNRGTLAQQVSNNNPTISGNGLRVAFTSTASNPNPTPQVPGTNIDNGDFNGEVYYANLNAEGTPTGIVQVTRTVRDNPSQVINLYNIGERMSRDGRYIAFESMSSTPGGGGTNQTVDGNSNYALFVFDSQTPTSIRQVGKRTFEDSGVGGGDVRRFPTFTDNDSSGTPSTIVFISRINYDSTGNIPSSGGLNPDAARNPQVYAATLTTQNVSNYVRLSRFQSFSDLQPYTSDSRRRITFNYVNELGGGNSDFTYEGFYLISSNVTPPDSNVPLLTFATGASALPVGSPLPTPSPTATPTPSPTPTPTGSPTPTPTPTPVTPTAVPALAPDMIAIAEFRGATSFEIINASGASRSTRSFELPIELGGVTVNFRSTAGNATNGGVAAAGIYTVDRQRRRVIFVIPRGLANGNYAVTINDNGNISRGSLDITGAQPDIITKNPLPSPGGRAVAFNATNRVLQVEPFAVTTFRLKPFGRVPTVIRLFATGIRGAAASQISVRVGSRTISGAQILTGAVPTDIPGVYSVDFTLPPEAIGAGDVPIVLTVINNSRLDDTAPRVRIL